MASTWPVGGRAAGFAGGLAGGLLGGVCAFALPARAAANAAAATSVTTFFMISPREWPPSIRYRERHSRTGPVGYRPGAAVQADSRAKRTEEPCTVFNGPSSARRRRLQLRSFLNSS